MTNLCIVSHDTCISIPIFRINTAETVCVCPWRSIASVTADLDRAVSQHVDEPDDRCMLCYKFRLRQLQQNKELLSLKCSVVTVIAESYQIVSLQTGFTSFYSQIIKKPRPAKVF